MPVECMSRRVGARKCTFTKQTEPKKRTIISHLQLAKFERDGVHSQAAELEGKRLDFCLREIVIEGTRKPSRSLKAGLLAQRAQLDTIKTQRQKQVDGQDNIVLSHFSSCRKIINTALRA